LRRKRAYQTGTFLKVEAEYVDEAKTILKDFKNVPDIQ